MSSKNEDIDVAARLKMVRDEKRLSQEGFASRLGVPLRSYQNYERGDRSCPVAVLRRLIGTFEVSPVWLLYGRGPMYWEEGKDAFEVREEGEPYVVSPQRRANRALEAVVDVQAELGLDLTKEQMKILLGYTYEHDVSREDLRAFVKTAFALTGNPLPKDRDKK